MRLDALLLRCVAVELRARLVGTAIRKISQLHDSDFLLTFYGRGETVRVVVSLSGDDARLHEVDQAPAGTVAEAPGAFVMLLRKHLEGARVLDVQTWGLERVVLLSCRRGGQDTVLAIELTILSRNWMLAGPGRILGTWHRPDERSVLPQVLQGPGPDPCSLSGVDLVARLGSLPAQPALQRLLFGLNRLAVSEVLALAGLRSDEPVGEAEQQALATAWDSFRGRVQEERFQPVWCEAARRAAPWQYSIWCQEITIEYESFSIMLNQRMGTGWARRGLEDRRQALLGRIERQRDKVGRRLAVQEQNLAALQTVERWQRRGELLLTATASPGRAGTVTVMDYYQSPPQSEEIEVDVRVSVSANAQQCFSRYKKGLRGRTSLALQLERGRLEQAWLLELEVAAVQAASLDELLEVSELLRGEDSRPVEPRGRTISRRKRPPIRSYRIGGFDVLVGRNPRQNEEISLRLASPDDLWLHARHVPGAHVVVRQAGVEVPDDVLQVAATLAAINSRAVAAGKVEVDYTRARYVRKLSHAPPGMVIYRQERTVSVRTDAEALMQLDTLIQS